MNCTISGVMPEFEVRNCQLPGHHTLSRPTSDSVMTYSLDKSSNLADLRDKMRIEVEELMNIVESKTSSKVTLMLP